MNEKKKINVIAVNHIDLGFVKRKEEQAELVEIWLERIFASLERYPQLRFAIEQAYHYRGLEQRRPDLFAKLKKYIAEGKIEMMGAMASSLETNFTNGESFVRNQSIGLRYTRKHLGTEPTAAWLIDTFGTNAQVPQILKQFGFSYLFANRFGGKIPYDMFVDQGLDGSEITVIGRDLACTQIYPDNQAFVFCRGWIDVDRLFAEADELKGDLPHLVVYYLENQEVFSTYCLDLIAERKERTDEEWVCSSYADYLKQIEGKTEGLMKIWGDLNPEFTGTFALRTPIKIWNRKAESSLLELEEWNALLDGNNDSSIENYWWDLSYVQFHDVFSGSHEDCTYLDVMHTLQNVVDGSKKEMWSFFERTEDSTKLLCLNGLPMEREEWIVLPNPEQKKMHVYQGNQELSVVCSDGQSWCRPTLAPVSMTALTITYEEEGAVEECREWTECQTCTLENRFLSMSFDKKTGIKELSLSNGMVLMKEVQRILTVANDKGGFQIDDCMGEEKILIDENVRIFYKKDTKEQKVRLSGMCDDMPWNHRQNCLEWSMEFALTDYAPCVGVKINLDWKGEAAKIRFLLPNTVDTAKGIYEIPFGEVKRSAYDGHATANGEWPAHRYVAVEDGEKGIALINSGVAGVETIGSTLATTLIRAYPDTVQVWIPVSGLTSQHGHHEYDFQIMPYKAGERLSVIAQAQKLNRPVQVSPEAVASSKEEGSLLTISNPDMVLSAVKAAEDGSGDLIVRYYEATGNPAQGSVYVRDAVSVSLSDVTEKAGEELSSVNQTVEVICKPYEIQTLRIRRQ